MFSRFDRIPACDRQTDGRTDIETSCHGIVRAMHTRRAVKTKQMKTGEFSPAFAPSLTVAATRGGYSSCRSRPLLSEMCWEYSEHSALSCPVEQLLMRIALIGRLTYIIIASSKAQQMFIAPWASKHIFDPPPRQAPTSKYISYHAFLTERYVIARLPYRDRWLDWFELRSKGQIFLDLLIPAGKPETWISYLNKKLSYR